MNEELRIRINKIHTDLMGIIQSFQPRYTEPFISDNIYSAVLTKIKEEDPTILIELFPEVNIVQMRDGFNIQIIYHRIH